MTGSNLPNGFESLERFVEKWALPDAAARMAERQASTIEDIRAFYDAITSLGVQALDHLREFQLGELPPQSECLLKLMLSLAECGPAIEWYNNPKVYDGFEVNRIRYLRQIPSAAAQN